MTDDLPAGLVKTEEIKRVLNAINEVKYGSVTLIIQNSRIMQIEKNEKIRLK